MDVNGWMDIKTKQIKLLGFQLESHHTCLYSTVHINAIICITNLGGLALPFKDVFSFSLSSACLDELAVRLWKTETWNIKSIRSVE